jgi:succinate dehydrogenase hydrophobic anchor subunit
MSNAKSETTLRQKISSRIQQTEIPIIVYAVVLISMFLLWRYRTYNEDIAMNFFAELFGAAFTLFIIDVLLVRSKAKKWKIVRDELNYLIARNVNRIRDGISTRIFNFNPEIEASLPEHQYLNELRRKRTDFLHEIVTLDEDVLIVKINESELFSEVSYEYFNEKAEEIWNILNIKYSDYFHPDLASYLISLNLNLKDLCGHIRQYMKSNRFSVKGETYKNIGRHGAAISLIKIIKLLNILKHEGYSEAASMELTE